MLKQSFFALLLLLPTAPAFAAEVFSATEDEMVVRNPEPLAIRRLPSIPSNTPKSRGPRAAGQIQRTPKKRKMVSAVPADGSYDGLDSGETSKPRKPQKKQMAGVAAPARETKLPAESRSKVQPANELAEFDLVPKDQLEPLARRLSLVEEIMRRHARAYDYRTYTIKELQDILAQLETDAAHEAETQIEAPPEYKEMPGT